MAGLAVACPMAPYSRADSLCIVQEYCILVWRWSSLSIHSSRCRFVARVNSARVNSGVRTFLECFMSRKIQQLLLGAAMLLTGPCPAADHPSTEIDALTASPANFILLLENEHVRVLEYVLLPGEQDKWHTHPPKVSYVLSGGKLEIHLDDGTSFLADEKTGTANWAGVRGKHYVKNVGSTPVRILLIENKAAAREVTSPPSAPTS